MPQSYFIFDFKTNEQAAQQARHRLEAWRQAFRLGKKLELKFERKSAGADAAGSSSPVEKEPAAEGETKTDGREEIRLIVRLDFSDYERLSHQRWLDRIPAEEPFKSAGSQVVRHGEERFETTRELFDSLK